MKLLLTCNALLAASSFASAGAPVFSVHPLGTPGLRLGRMADYGTLLARGPDDSTWLGRNGQYQKLPPYPGDRFNAVGVNSSGTVLGYLPAHIPLFRTILHKDGAYFEVVPGSAGFTPAGIDGTDRIAGTIFGDQIRSAVWNGEQLIDLPTTIESRAYAVNENGAVVGFDNQRPTIWHAGSYEREVVPMDSGVAWGISPRGTVTGYGRELSDSPDLGYFVRVNGSVRWYDRRDHVNPTLMKVNDRGDSIVRAPTYDNRFVHRLLLMDGQTWLQDEIKLDSTEWRLGSLDNFAPDGSILATVFSTTTGQSDIALLRPVPEPATLAVLGTGLAALARRRRKSA